MFALIDCNNFYASCERVFRPDLIGKPVVVLSNNDGCIIARSNEAKALDIPMGAPAFKYKEILGKHNVHVFSSNYALYGDLSARIMNLLSEMAPEIEIYSIDEAFLKFDNCPYLDFSAHAMAIKKKVENHTGMSISVGFAPTKALAKIANSIAKRYMEQTNGVHIIDSEERRVKALKWTSVRKVWGIGGQHTKRLQKIGVNTSYDFTQLPDEWVRKHMSVMGLRLKKDLEGKPTLDIEKVKKKKNIATTRSFEKNHTDYESIKERVITFAISCAEKLRHQKSCCSALLVFLHTNGHRKELPQYSKNMVVKLPFSTNSSIELSHYAVKGLDCIFKEGYSYKKAGVIALEFNPENEQQLSFFENTNPKHKAVMDVMDKINRGVGQQKLKLASQDMGRQWKMRQEKLSPRYTTRLNEILTIKA